MARAPCCCCWVCDCCCSNATDWRAAFSATRWLLCSSGVFIAVMVSMLTRSCAGSSTRPCTAKVRAASGSSSPHRCADHQRHAFPMRANRITVRCADPACALHVHPAHAHRAGHRGTTHCPHAPVDRSARTCGRCHARARRAWPARPAQAGRGWHRWLLAQAARATRKDSGTGAQPIYISAILVDHARVLFGKRTRAGVLERRMFAQKVAQHVRPERAAGSNQRVIRDQKVSLAVAIAGTAQGGDLVGLGVHPHLPKCGDAALTGSDAMT